jgi:hypothetical protein
MALSNMKKKGLLRTAFECLEKNPEKNVHKLVEVVDQVAEEESDSFSAQRAELREVLKHPESSMYHLVMRVLHDTDREVLKTAFENFFLNASIIGDKKKEEYRKKYHCDVPWAISLDPSLEETDEIIEQGMKRGTYLYVYTGEELMAHRKKLIALCEKYSDCQFICFTNATLIDQMFAHEVLHVKNFIPVIRVEGLEETTESRRGMSAYLHAAKAMEIMNKRRLPFGISVCYTSQNMESVSSMEFIDQMIEWGAQFIMYFQSTSMENETVSELRPTLERQELMKRRIRKIRETKPIFVTDFQNAEYFWRSNPKVKMA